MVRLRIVIEPSSELHIGTGAGLGEVVDAGVVRDRQGRPTILGSSIKGLARDAASVFPPTLARPGWVGRVFGARGTPGAVEFGNAWPGRNDWKFAVHGRSARDRTTGRARDDALYRFEDATASSFVTDVVAPGGLSEGALALLIAALRRIEAIGGQRRRGKGQVTVSVRVEEGPSGWAGAEVPGHAPRFEEILGIVLNGGEPADIQPAEAPKAAAAVAGAWGVRTLFAWAEAPLVITESPETGNAAHSLLHVPGTAVRGAFAAFLVHRGWRTDDARFESFFLREQVQFGPLFPSPGWNSRGSLPWPTPRSLFTCKSSPGARGDVFDGHGVADLLRLNGKVPAECAECKAALIPLDGVLQASRAGNPAVPWLRRAHPALGSRLRTAIDSETKRAAEGQLYAQHFVPERTWFAGHVWGDEGLLAELEQAVAEGLRLSVGKARTRGHGTLQGFLRRSDGGHPVYPDLLQPGSGPAGGAAAGASGFTVTLLSDLIAVDLFLRPLTRLDASSLWGLLGGHGDPPFQVREGQEYSTPRRIAGFNGVPGRPRTMDVAIAAGSCWAFRWIASANAAAWERLKVAEERGLGLRRGEGFGRIAVDFPVHHQQLDQTASRTADVGDIMAETSAVDRDLPEFPAARPIRPIRGDIPHGLHPDDVPQADRDGLSRFVLELAEMDDDAARLRRLDAVIEARRRRVGSDDSTGKRATSEFLGTLAAIQREQPISRENLLACAAALRRAD